MGHFMDGGGGNWRCVEITHVQNNHPCTWLTVMDVNQAVELTTLDGDDLREISLALASRWTRANTNGLPKRAERIMRLMDKLEIRNLETLRMDTEEEG